MPITLNIGLTKKIGLPDYGSYGASCHVEVELDAGLLRDDLDGFHKHVRGAFVACRQAVNDELAREQPTNSHETVADTQPPTNGNGHHAANGKTNGRTRDRTRRATASQIRAIDAIAHRQRVDLATLLQARFGIQAAGELTITEASALIDELKATVPGGRG